jgi:hypothetical protein
MSVAMNDNIHIQLLYGGSIPLSLQRRDDLQPLHYLHYRLATAFNDSHSQVGSSLAIAQCFMQHFGGFAHPHRHTEKYL